MPCYWTPTVPVGHQTRTAIRFVLKPTIPMHQPSRGEEAPPAAVGDRVNASRFVTGARFVIRKRKPRRVLVIFVTSFEPELTAPLD